MPPKQSLFTASCAEAGWRPGAWRDATHLVLTGTTRYPRGCVIRHVDVVGRRV